jgi:hypothetical protein
MGNNCSYIAHLSIFIELPIQYVLSREEECMPCIAAVLVGYLPFGYWYGELRVYQVILLLAAYADYLHFGEHYQFVGHSIKYVPLRLLKYHH